MPGSLTQLGRSRAIQAAVGQAVSTAAGMYVALATGVPSNPNPGNLSDFATYELTTAGYARQAVTWTVDSSAGTSVTIQNSNTMDFGPFGADPPAVTHAFLCDASTGTSGTVLAWWELDTARNADAGDTLRFAAGDLKITLT
jgi:hypothetical protein